ncbi:zinc-binding alcohol dehydrogenase family protein [Devosia sp. FKR38]|uniref:zinc-binding alcohol dehydrogenase family protein n=1 Tax=Devosia sp. FKR38 TaxID=2562312 RepID=UPI0010C0DD48|nr:zinc-binding alcohol dehydrogenase family protein [Devosia sp. FKR38]
MNALICSEPGVLSVIERPKAERAPGEVLVRPRRVGICGTDYHIYEGKHPFLAYPRVMGHELAVEVVEPGDSDFKAGEVVVVNPYLSCGTCIACRRGKPNCCTKIAVLGVHRDGGMAEFISLPAKNLVRAEGLSADACATVEFLAIGAHAVRRASLDDTDRVLVIGAGPIGFGAVLFATLSGAKVTVMDRDQERLAAARDLFSIAGTITADDSVDAQVAAATDGEGFDVVFDATGNQGSIEKGFDFVAHGGRYVLVSVVKGDITFVDSDFHRKEMSIFGSRNATSVDFERVIAAIRNGQVPIDKLITHRTTLAGAVTDLPRWATQKSGLIKAVIEIA